MDINKILVPYEGSPSSEEALKKAIVTAKIFNAEVTVVFVITDATSEALSARVEEITKSRFSSQNIKMDFVTRKGSRIYNEISALEKTLDVDLIIMGTHGVKGFQEFWIGSNALKVVSMADCPVITIQEIHYPETFQKILLPISDSDQSRQKVPLVTKLAMGFDAEVVVYAVSKDVSEKARLHKYADQVGEYLKENGVIYSFAEDYGRNVAESCIDFAKNNGVDLISIMTDTESSNSYFMGFYAEQIVNHSPVPVLSIHARAIHLDGSFN